MKVLLVSPLQKNANGGIAVWTDMFLSACESAGIEPSVLNIAMTGKRLENGSEKRNLFDEIFRTGRIFRDLKVLLKKEKYDVAHINTSCGKFGIVRDYMTAKKIRKKQPGVKIVVQYHCDIPAQVKSEKAKKNLEKLAKIADENLVLCSSSARYLKENFGIDSRIVPNFIEEKHICSDEKIINEKIFRAFFVGRVQPAKGANEIYDLATRMPEIEFRLAGALAPSMQGKEVPANVNLLGPLPHDEVLLEMMAADIFIFPSHTEGFSVALLEAMASGLPAIATDVGANADMLSGCGEIVSVGDVDALAAAMESLSPCDVRARLSLASIDKVKNEYALNKVLQRIKNTYID